MTNILNISGDKIVVSNFNPNKKGVNKITYVLLTFFLGCFGLHKFYEGNTSQGILYLLFCWLLFHSLSL